MCVSVSSRCCNCCRTSSVMEDNCCGCNSSAILQMTDISEEDIVYASFSNRVSIAYSYCLFPL